MLSSQSNGLLLLSYLLFQSMDVILQVLVLLEFMLHYLDVLLELYLPSIGSLEFPPERI
jgi:hypothetical protein